MGSHLTKNIESNRQSKTDNKSDTKTNSDIKCSTNNSDPNRRKSSVESVSTPEYLSSTSIKPIGTNSLTQTKQIIGQKSEQKITIPAEIVVVSDGSVAQELDQIIIFPPTFKPLIPIGYETLSHSYPQLNPQYVIDFGLIIEQQLKTKSEFVAKEQQKLVDRIKDIDLIVSYVSNQFIIERQKRLIKVSENLLKIEEISGLIEKCEKELINCENNFEKLNNFLPKSLCLEKFSFQKTD